MSFVSLFWEVKIPKSIFIRRRDSGEDCFCVSDLSIHEAHEWRSILTDEGPRGTFRIASCLKKKNSSEKMTRGPFRIMFLKKKNIHLACTCNHLNIWRLRLSNKKRVTSAVGLPPPEHCRLRGGVLSAQAGLYKVQVKFGYLEQIRHLWSLGYFWSCEDTKGFIWSCAEKGLHLVRRM